MTAAASTPAVRLMGRAPAERVLFIEDSNMHPTIRRDSVVFLGTKNQWEGEGLYALPGMEDGVPDRVYRVGACPDGVHLWYDNWPDHANPLHVYSRQTLREIGFWPVVGMIQPMQGEFGLFLRDQFGEARP